MEFRRFGTLEVSVVGLGCNNFGMRIDEAASAAVVEACLDNVVIAPRAGAKVFPRG